MQGLSDGYFIIPYTIGNYIAGTELDDVDMSHEAFDEAAQNAQNHVDKLLNVDGDKSVIEFHRELGQIMWDKVGISRSEEGLNHHTNS